MCQNCVTIRSPFSAIHWFTQAYIKCMMVSVTVKTHFQALFIEYDKYF